MAYCILRAKKLKGFGAVASSAMHTFRESDTPNADPARTNRNWHAGATSSAAVLAALRARLPKRRRKDAVLTIEYLVTASPEFFLDAETQRQRTRSDYFNAAMEFLRTKHGKENVICTSLHLDETTPHLIVYVVPINAKGNLSAKDFLGGRQKLSQMQTAFHADVGQRFGLERGIQGSSVSHQRVKSFYAEINHETALPELKVGDKVADLFGIRTEKIELRKEQEVALLAKSSVSENKVIAFLKSSMIKLRAQLKREIDRAERAFGELAVERKQRLASEKELLEANKKVQILSTQARDIHQQLSQLQSNNSRQLLPHRNGDQHGNENTEPRLAI
jgi:hypothetical protein